MFEQYLEIPVEFSSLEEFKNIDFVKRRMEKEDFVQFSRSSNDALLMAEYSVKFYVCGFLEDCSKEFLDNFPLFDISKYDNDQ